MTSETLKRKRGYLNDGGKDKIMVAIDFGTTFSGCAWSHTSTPHLRNVIIQWPNAISDGLEGVTRPKVAIEIQYTESDIVWGYKIPDSAPRHSWFKLELDPMQGRNLFSLTKQLPSSKASPSCYDITPEKMVTDFLTKLRQHVEQVLRFKVSEETLAVIPLQFCVTVPAVWSETAQTKTRACAVAAGLTKDEELLMITEPEAAATYALDVLPPNDLQVGSTFVLCDAGGGTVDLISYTIMALKPLLKVKEAAPGTGALCGSTFINRLFESFLVRKLGHDPLWDDEVLQEALIKFENFTKGSYSGGATEQYSIPVSGLSDNPTLNIRRGKLTVTGADLHEIFQPVINEVITLVKGQIRATRPNIPKVILLVGGFGQSSYLRECIRKAVSNSGIAVLQSPHGWTAVVEGALMRALSQHSPRSARVEITERKARKHYGLDIGVEFDRKKHDILKRYWDSCDGFWRVFVMQWFVKKGESVMERQPVRIQLTRTPLVSDGHPSKIETQIFYCVAADDTGAPFYEDDIVKKLVVVTADLSVIPSTSLRKCIGKDGLRYYDLKYEIEITYYSASTKYELIYNRKNYGTVHAEQV